MLRRAVLTASSRVRAASTASTASAFPSRSLLDAILGRSRSTLVPLQMPFPSPSPSPEPAAPLTAAAVTELSNGVRVVTQETGLASSTVGLVVAAGARHAPVRGQPQVLARLGLQSTENKSQIANTRAMSELGRFQSEVQRDFMTYAADVMPTDAKAAFGIIADTALNGLFEGDEVTATVSEYERELKAMSGNAELATQEALHATAFGGTELARYVHATPEGAPALNDPESLRSFRDSRFIARNIVVVGAGVDHGMLVAEAEALLEDLPSNGCPVNKASYSGGELRQANSSADAMAHVALGFGCGGWHSSDVVPACALSILMGGGGSFSAGGPGKGMYSRLYTRVLNGNQWVHSATCNTSLHDEAALFSFYGVCAPSDADKMMLVLAREAAEMKRGFSEEEVSRAKNQLRSALYMNLESRNVLFEDLGQQFLVYGRRMSPDELAQKIDAVTAEDLSRVVQILLDSNPTLVVSGDTDNKVPSHSAIRAALKK